MTNKDKLLRDDVSVEEFAKEFEAFCIMMKEENIVMTYKEEMKEFLNCEIKPTLTEDERVILRNIKNNKAIGRDKDNCLYFVSKGDGRFFVNSTFGHLFQFIKEGEEYNIEELIK